MENVDVDNIFWDTITNATRFINEVIQTLTRKDKNESIILNSSDEIPWYNSFSSKVKGKIENYDKGIHHEDELEHDHIFEDKDELENYILNNSNYFEGKKQNEYRSSMKLSEFMAKNDDGILLHKKYIWIDVYSRKGFENWVKFASEYIEAREKYLEDKYDKIIARFIISYHGYSYSTYKIKSYSFKNYINWYDCYVFFTTLSNSININDYFKLYLSELLTSIIRENKTGKCIELCVDCLKDYDNLLKNPYSKINSIFSKCKIEKDVKEIIYHSQIRVFYPMLNEFRLYYFTKQYEEGLQKIIDCDNEWLIETCKQKHEVLPTEPKYFQFGTLKQCGKDKKVIYKYNDKDALLKYGDARNDLSHIDIVKFNLLEEIVDIFIKKVH